MAIGQIRSEDASATAEACLRNQTDVLEHIPELRPRADRLCSPWAWPPRCSPGPSSALAATMVGLRLSSTEDDLALAPVSSRPPQTGLGHHRRRGGLLPR